MVGWHHWLNGHEFEHTLGDSEGQGSLACCSPWGCTKRLSKLLKVTNQKILKPEFYLSPIPKSALLVKVITGIAGMEKTWV